MQQMIRGAIRSGLSRAQAYEIWNRAVLLKKTKVFQELRRQVLEYASWSEIESIVRKFQLSQEQYQILKSAYHRYQP